MNLSEYDGKYVRVRDANGNDFTGRASYGSADFLECEWGMDEDGIFVEDILICNPLCDSLVRSREHRFSQSAGEGRNASRSYREGWPDR